VNQLLAQLKLGKEITEKSVHEAKTSILVERMGLSPYHEPEGSIGVLAMHKPKDAHCILFFIRQECYERVKDQTV